MPAGPYRARYVEIEVLTDPGDEGITVVRSYGQVVHMRTALVQAMYVPVFTTTADEIEVAG